MAPTNSSFPTVFLTILPFLDPLLERLEKTSDATRSSPLAHDRRQRVNTQRVTHNKIFGPDLQSYRNGEATKKHDKK